MKRAFAIALLFLLVQGSVAAAAQKEEIVYYNVRSHKYHCLECYYAHRCTANCVAIAISEAKHRGGVPCKICGGTCRR